MINLTKGILCSESPLLPAVEPGHISSAVTQIYSFGANPINTIANATLRRGEASYKYCSKNYGTLSSRHHFHISDLNHFFNGFSIPLIALIVATNNSAQKVLKIAQNNSEEDTKLNSYLAQVIRTFSADLKQADPRSSFLVSTKVFSYCEQNPFVSDEYTLLGIVSARTTYTEFFTRIEL